MFETFTEKARRVIFFARYEASALGSKEMAPEHLLLGLLRENTSTANQYFRSPTAPESIRKRLEDELPRGEKISTSVDLPLSSASCRAIANAMEASKLRGHKHVAPGHLLMGIMRLENCLAASLLREHEVTIPETGEGLQEAELTLKEEPSEPPPSIIRDACRDLTADTDIPPLIGRESELQSLMQVLGRRSGNNPVLIGEPGVGKTAIVQGLASRIADQQVPEFLRQKRVLAVVPDRFNASPGNRRQFELRFSTFVDELAKESDVILFVDGLFEPIRRSASPFAQVLDRLLAALSFSHCIATGTPQGFRAALERDPVIERYFRAIPIAPPDENETLPILHRLAKDFEAYHGVTYDSTAIDTAIRASVQFLPRLHLPGKAADLLDEAGARVKIRLEKQKAEQASNKIVTSGEIETIVSEMTGIPVDAIRRRLAGK